MASAVRSSRPAIAGAEDAAEQLSRPVKRAPAGQRRPFAWILICEPVDSKLGFRQVPSRDGGRGAVRAPR